MVSLSTSNEVPYHEQMLEKLSSAKNIGVVNSAIQGASSDAFAQSRQAKLGSIEGYLEKARGSVDSIQQPQMFDPSSVPDPVAATQPVQQQSAPVGKTAAVAPVAASGDLGKFLNAISSKESGGNYGARNKDSGAAGKYQIMPANIPSWSKEALGKSVTVSQFLASPEIQEKVAQYKLSQYYNKYGAAGASVAWYAGEGNAKKYVANGGAGYNKKQGNYPSVSSYAQDILKRMGAK